MRTPLIRHTKRSVIARVEREYRALDRAVRELRPANFRRPVPGFGERARIKRERWTVHDAIAHIVYWKRWQAHALHRKGADPALRGLPVHEQNAVIWRRWHRVPPEELVAEHRAAHRDALALIRALPDSFFTSRPRKAQWPNDLVGHPAWHRTHHVEPVLAAISVSAPPGPRGRARSTTRGRPAARGAQTRPRPRPR